MPPTSRPKRDFSADTGLLALCALALPVGAMATLAAKALVALIRLFTNLFYFQTLSLADRSPAGHHLGWVAALLPALGGLIVGLMARYGSPRIRGHGIPEAIEAILFGKSQLSPRVAVLKPLSSGIVIGSGGPFGAEGPIIMTGGALGSLTAQLLPLTAAERKTLLVCGATAGMTAIFGTPAAAVLLGVELLLFEWRPRSLLPVIVACAVAGFARGLFFEPGPLFALSLPAPAAADAPWCAAAGLAAGLLAAGLSRLLYAVEDLFDASRVHWMWWPAIGGLVVGLGGLLQPRVLGVGYDVINDLLHDRLLLEAALALLAVKALVWVVALGSGTSGGVLAPLLMMGAGLGAAFGLVAPHDPLLWPLVCMAGVLAGVLGAPLTAALFAYELTGAGTALLPLLLVCGVAHGVALLVAPRSIMTEKIARRGRHVYREYAVDPQERTHADEVMTLHPMTIAAETPLAAVRAGWFGAEQRHRAFPVVDARGRLAGMLERATLERLLQDHAHHVPLGDALALHPPAFALPGESCRVLAQRMVEQEVERLPVVASAEDRTLLGIVSRSDLLRPLRTVMEEEEVRERLIGG